MRKATRLGSILSACLIAGLSSSLEAVAADPSATAAESGIWEKHQYSFSFLGFTSTYSCDGLADKLKLLLIASGARADVIARPGACASDFGRPDKFARADLTFYTLKAPTTDATGMVAGIWRPVALTSHKPYDLGVGDCELVEQFRTNVLSMFAIRNEDNHTTCIPHQDSGSVIDLKFDAFTAPPPAKTAQGNPTTLRQSAP